MSASSSSATSPLELDLRSSPFLTGLPAALMAGEGADLLSPLSYLSEPDELPRHHAQPDRKALARALETANQSFGHPRARELARKLQDPATCTVVTGQQPGLLGGPLYTLTKIVAAAKWAQELEARDQPAVAVFWVATEDHDYAEVSQAVLPTPNGPQIFALAPDPSPLLPVGMRVLGEGIRTLLGEMRTQVTGERYASWLEAIAGWYRPEARFGEAFCRLMIHLLGARCPLLLDGANPVLKSAQRPLLRRLVERRSQVEEALQRAEGRIRQAGHPLQVNPQPGSSPLFLLSAQRRRIQWHDGSHFTLRGGSAADRDNPRSIHELVRIIDENPSVVSPGVLARPALQDAVLGTSLQILGPGELAYMAQAAALYPVLEVEAPATTLRPLIVVLEKRQLERMEQLAVSLSDLLIDDDQLRRRMADEAGADFVVPVQDRIEALLDSLREPAVSLDPQLERPWSKTRRQVLQAMTNFGTKVVDVAGRQDETRERRLRGLRDACLPLGRLQERVLSSAHFPGKYGVDFVQILWQQMMLSSRRLQVICPGEPESGR